MADQLDPAAPLVVEVHQRPRRVLGVRGLRHRVPRLGVRGVLSRAWRLIGDSIQRFSGPAARSAKRSSCCT